MTRMRFGNLRPLAMMLILMLALILMGCSHTKAVLPDLGEKAVLETPLLERPKLETLTPEEKKAIPRTAKGKILRCLAGWEGYGDVADAAVKAHQDYERSLFSGDKRNK